MNYNAYIVRLKHKDTGFTGNLALNGATLAANFKKIGKDLWIANLKNQAQFMFLQDIPLLKKNKDVKILLPVTSKYNKRKLTKLSKFLTSDDFEDNDPRDILLNFITIEKFVRAQELLDFFSISRDTIIPYLLEKEIHKELKLIDLTYLSITAYDTILGYRDSMNAILSDCYTSRTKSIKLSEIETQLKLPQSSILFKYLLYSFKDQFSFRIRKEKIVFSRLALSDVEKDSVAEIETVIKQNKISIFTIDSILNHTDLTNKEVNDALWLMVDGNRLAQLNEKYFIFQDELNKILNKLKKYKRNQGEIIDIQAFRELTLFSRKFIIILFEYFDTHQVTERVDNKRKILLGV
jgi:hypothetical protein